MKNRYSSKIISSVLSRACNLLKKARKLQTPNRHDDKNGVSVWEIFSCSSH